jgi:hypothetical protein
VNAWLVIGTPFVGCFMILVWYYRKLFRLYRGSYHEANEGWGRALDDLGSLSLVVADFNDTFGVLTSQPECWHSPECASHTEFKTLLYSAHERLATHTRKVSNVVRVD